MFDMELYCLPKLQNVLGGKEFIKNTGFGKTFFEVKGEGEPLLLIHDIGVGASNFEWRHNYEELSRRFQVYALDLPGFARSEKRPIQYTALVYTRIITEFIQSAVRKPVYIISSGLSAAYSCFVAYNTPEWVKGLALITPLGVSTYSAPPGPASFIMYDALRSPIQGDAVYDAFSSRSSIEYELTHHIYSNPDLITPSVVDYLFAAAHQPPFAKFAPASFMAGFSSINITPILQEIDQPLLVVWGKLAKPSRAGTLEDFLSILPDIRSHLFHDCGLLPHVEKAQEFNELLTDFLMS